MNKIIALFAMVFWVSACTSTARIGYAYEDKNIDEEYIGTLLAVRGMPHIYIEWVDGYRFNATGFDLRPTEVRVLPGIQNIRLIYENVGQRGGSWGHGDIEIDVVAGHTYQMVAEQTEDGKQVIFSYKDLGLTKDLKLATNTQTLEKHGL